MSVPVPPVGGELRSVLWECGSVCDVGAGDWAGKGGGVQLATATVSTTVYTCGTTHRGIGIYPMVLTCNRGYGVVHGCGVGRCGCGMPPDHPRCHPCYTLCVIRAGTLISYLVAALWSWIWCSCGRCCYFHIRHWHLINVIDLDYGCHRYCWGW